MLGKLAFGLAVFHAILLQFAFAGLIANGTVERVIYEQAFQHSFAHLFCLWAAGVNFHARNQIRGAADHALGRGAFVGQHHRINLQGAILVHRRFAIRTGPTGHAYVYEAHPAVAGHWQFWVITVMGDLDPGMLTRLQHRGWHEITLPISCELGHIDLSPIYLYSGGLNRGWLVRFGFLRHGQADTFSSNLSLNLSTKLRTGQAQASPKAQMVRPWMLCAICLRYSGSSTRPSP